MCADSFVALRGRTRAVGELFGLDKLDCIRFVAAVWEILRITVQSGGDRSIAFLYDLDGPSDAVQHVVAQVVQKSAGTPRSGHEHDALASAQRLADRFSVEQTVTGDRIVTIAMARPKEARRLAAADLATIAEQVARHKTRSPLEELEQQNREMVLALQALKDRQAVLEVADERKNKFVSTLAHELRNPLGTLQMTLHILRHKPAFEAPEMIKHHVVMSRQAEQLNRLANDLLGVARVGQGKVELQLRPTDVNELVCQALEMTGAAIKAKEHHVETKLLAAPLWVNANSTRLKQALSNLLQNAARYSNEHGRITVTCGGTRRMQRWKSPTRASASPPTSCPTCSACSCRVANRAMARLRGWVWA